MKKRCCGIVFILCLPAWAFPRRLHHDKKTTLLAVAGDEEL